ncbi:MAG TPA: hypothetical protein VM029_23245, partial [Opitutaceae bacterium]|nr:hypothetical protein [Opitutaceae bacterium]
VNPLANPLDDALAAIDRGHTRAVAVSALPPSAIGAARQTCRRIRLRCPRARVVVGVWQQRADLDALRDRISATRPDAAVSTLRSAVAELEKLLAGPSRSTTPFVGHVDQPLAPRPPASRK